MTKNQILLKMLEVDDQILKMTENKYTLDFRKIDKLKKAELERLLDAFETLYEAFSKLKKEEKNNGLQNVY